MTRIRSDRWSIICEYQYVVQSWDTAFTAEPTSDFSVCMTFGLRDRVWHLLDLYRDRLDYPVLRRKAAALWKQWQPSLAVIENAGTGITLVQDLRFSELRDH
jgi:phage terminase large subunit-like protein